MRIPTSRRSGIYWPAMPTFVDATVLTLQHQFEQSQWWPAETLLQHQLRQLEPLLAHTARTVPFYRGRLDAIAGLRRGELTMDAWRRLPVLSRTDIQEAGAALVSRRLPKDHGDTSDISTSGSTGRPVTVKATAITTLFFRALTLRNHVWHGRDFSGTTAKITRQSPSAAGDETGPHRSTWVPGYPSGAVTEFDVARPAAEQLAWLAAENPNRLVTYPTNLLSLVRRSEETGFRLPGLRDVATMGEVFAPDVRAACEHDERIQWMGRVESDRVSQIVADATCLVMPSICYETFGRTIIEAFSVGTPVIASRLGAMAENVEHGSTGMLFDAGDAEQLCAVVERMFEQTDLTKMRNRAWEEYEEKYTPERNYHLLIDLYQRVMQGKQPSGEIDSLVTK